MNKDIIGSAQWNNAMYSKGATPYSGIAGFISQQRLQAIVRFAKLQSSDAVLDIGCEAGAALFALPHCQRKVGTDISSCALDDASKKAGEHGENIEFVQADACENLPFKQGEFDVIICSEMLEHVPHPEQAIQHIYDIATEDTRIILTVPIEWPKLIIKRCLRIVGIFRFLFPAIEPGQSEWHLHRFNHSLLHAYTDSLFTWESSRNICGCHVVASLRKRTTNVPDQH